MTVKVLEESVLVSVRIGIITAASMPDWVAVFTWLSSSSTICSRHGNHCTGKRENLFLVRHSTNDQYPILIHVLSKLYFFADQAGM